jgi:hypothetical protein
MDCTAGCVWFHDKAQASAKQLDIGLSKEIGLPGNTKVVARVDIINLLNTNNLGDYGRLPWESNYQEPRGMSGPMRTIKLGMKYIF